MQYKFEKIFRFDVPIVKQKGKPSDKGFYVVGYAATTDLDRQGDIILKEALEKAADKLKTINSTVFYNHQYDLDNAVGKVIDATVDDKGLLVKIYVSQLAKDLRVKIQEGIISKFSIGGKLVDAVEIPIDEAIKNGYLSENIKKERPNLKFVLVIKEMELYEVSFVGIPANAQAQVLESFSKALYKCIKQNEEEKGGEIVEKKDIKKQEELSEKEIKDLLEDEVNKEEEKKEEVKEEMTDKEKKEEDKEEYEYYYYYYYGKKMRESIEEIKAEIKDIKNMLEELTKLVKEKVKTITVVDNKKSLIKNEDKEEENNKEEDPDELFYKYLTNK